MHLDTQNGETEASLQKLGGEPLAGSGFEQEEPDSEFITEAQASNGAEVGE